MNTLTQEIREAIENRHERERMAKIGAERRFAAEQEAIENRRSRNRALFSVAVLISVSAWGYNKLGEIKQEGAQEAQILAKSDMSMEQVKALHIIGTPAEKMGGK